MDKKKLSQIRLVKESYPYPLNQVYQGNVAIKVDNGARTQVCRFPCAVGDKQSEHLLEMQKNFADLFAASPALATALKVLLRRYKQVLESKFTGDYAIELAQEALSQAGAYGLEEVEVKYCEHCGADRIHVPVDEENWEDAEISFEYDPTARECLYCGWINMEVSK